MDEPWDEREEDPPEEVDLHGLTVDQALRRVAQALHAARVRRLTRLVVVTGAGWGNPDQKPVLRPRIEAWLRGPEGRSFGVKDVRRTSKGGALDVRLG
jgi:DNA-nicking Smr family endonuclease